MKDNPNNVKRVSPAMDGTAGGRRSESLLRAPTVSHVLGEVVWIAAKSGTYNSYTAAQLVSSFLPAIQCNQFLIARQDTVPLGAIFWAFVDDPTDRSLEGLVRDNSPLNISERLWQSGENCWVIATLWMDGSDNQLLPVFIADLIAGPLRGVRFKMVTTSESGSRTVSIEPDAGDRLVHSLETIVRAAGN